jgi:hypothetical protein
MLHRQVVLLDCSLVHAPEKIMPTYQQMAQHLLAVEQVHHTLEINKRAGWGEQQIEGFDGFDILYITIHT